MLDNNTTGILNTLNKIESSKELDEFLKENLKEIQEVTFADYFNFKIKDKNLNKSEIIKISGISREYAYQILNGTKNPRRNKVIALCLSAKLSRRETEKCLVLAGENSLYPKSKKDAIIIFALNKGLDIITTNELLFEKGEELLR